VILSQTPLQAGPQGFQCLNLEHCLTGAKHMLITGAKHVLSVKQLEAALLCNGVEEFGPLTPVAHGKRQDLRVPGKCHTKPLEVRPVRSARHLPDCVMVTIELLYQRRDPSFKARTIQVIQGSVEHLVSGFRRAPRVGSGHPCWAWFKLFAAMNPCLEMPRITSQRGQP
jgi:hypothetical protein